MFNEIPIFEQILRNFTAAINSSSPLAHASNLRNQAVQHEILSNERKKERHEGRCLEECLERGQVIAVRWCVPEQCWLVDTWPLAR